VQALAPAVQTLYAELVERRTALDAARTIGDAPGTFVTKSVKGQLYYYFQHTAPGGGLRQVYLGRKTPALEAAGRPLRERGGCSAARIGEEAHKARTARVWSGRELPNLRQATAAPRVLEVGALSHVENQPRLERDEAVMSGVPYTVVDDSVRAGLAEANSERL
jgi:hypothetical protein